MRNRTHCILEDGMVPATLSWGIMALLSSFIPLFRLICTTLNWRIVRFKSPRWMITKR